MSLQWLKPNERGMTTFNQPAQNIPPSSIVITLNFDFIYFRKLWLGSSHQQRRGGEETGEYQRNWREKIHRVKPDYPLTAILEPEHRTQKNSVFVSSTMLLVPHSRFGSVLSSLHHTDRWLTGGSVLAVAMQHGDSVKEAKERKKVGLVRADR